MAKLKLRVSGMAALIHHRRTTSPGKAKPETITLAALDPTKADDTLPPHLTRLIINVRHLADKSRADEIITIRDEGKDDGYSQYGVWNLSRAELSFRGIEQAEPEARRRELPEGKIPAIPDMAYHWEGIEWIADLQKALGKDLVVKEDVLKPAGQGVNALIQARVTVDCGRQIGLMPSPTFRRKRFELGEYKGDKTQAFSDAVQWAEHITAGQAVSITIGSLDGGGKGRTIQCVEGDVAIGISNLPQEVQRPGMPGVHDDFKAYYHLLDGANLVDPPIPMLAARETNPRSVDPVFCMMALAFARNS